MKVIVVLPFQYGKNGHEIPFSLPLFPDMGYSCRAEVEPLPPRTMLPFTHLDEIEGLASRSVSGESYPELGRLQQANTSSEN